MVVNRNNYKEVKGNQNIQRVLLTIFSSFHIFCEENNLIYNLFGGSLLGAVRHKGFIPWDDDIDLTMPLDDYKKMLKMIGDSKDLYVLDFSSSNYAYPYAKVCLKDTILIEHNLRREFSIMGAFIDVFPAVDYPEKESDFFFRKLEKYHIDRCRSVERIDYPRNWISILLFPIRILFRLPYRIIGPGYFIKKEINLLESKRPATEYLLLHGAGWGEKGKIHKQLYYNRTKYDFNGIRVNGITDYDGHLKKMYGDYTKIPPIEERNTQHSYTLYVKKELYNRIFCEA